MGPSVPRLGAVRCGKSCRSLNVKDCSVTVSYGRAVKAGRGRSRPVTFSQGGLGAVVYV